MTTRIEAGRRDAVATAYHEAGHAVAAHMLGRAFTRVSIEADAQFVGRCSFRPPGDWFRPHERVDARTRHRLEERIMISLAGPETEARFTGEYDQDAAQDDLVRATELADCMCGGDPEEGSAYLEWLARRTLRLMRHPRFWPAVEALATALLDRGEVRYRAAKELIARASSVERVAGGADGVSAVEAAGLIEGPSADVGRSPTPTG